MCERVFSDNITDCGKVTCHVHIMSVIHIIELPEKVEEMVAFCENIMITWMIDTNSQWSLDLRYWCTDEQ